MPELPEVEITMRKLAPKLTGRRIISFVSDWPRGLKTEYKRSLLAKDISGRKIKKLSRRGKVLYLHLTGRNNMKLAFHQRMSGRLAVLPAILCDSRVKYVRVKLGLDNKYVLAFVDPRKFGVVWYGSDEQLSADKYLSGLGIDALTVTWPQFRDRLAQRRIAIKPFLLRQDIFAGIGNIIADETLWLARINPKRSIGSLTVKEKKSLFVSLKRVLNKSINLGGSSMRNWLHPDENRGGFQEKWKAYGRSGESCYRCEHLLEKEIVGGRGTVYCPHCQKK